MSQVYPQKYYYNVCPHCKSKRLTSVALIQLPEEQYCHYVSHKDSPNEENPHIHKTGYLCRNCGRYIPMPNLKGVYDRAEMRRDIATLQKFLGEPK